MADFKPAGADGDFQAWAKHHAHDKQLHDLQIAEGKQGDGDAEVSSAHLQEDGPRSTSMKSVSTTTPLRWSAISNAVIALACSC